MEITAPALHSAFGRGFLCLSPPPSPQLLTSYSSSTIWCVLTAMPSPLQASHSSPSLPCTVPLAHPNAAPLIHPVLLPPIPSLLPSLPLHPPLSRPPLAPSPTLTLPFHSHCLGSINSPISNSSPTMSPLSLLPSFLLALCWARNSYSPSPPPSLSLCSHRMEPVGCVCPPPTPRILFKRIFNMNKQECFWIFAFLERVEPLLWKIPKFTFRDIKFRSALAQTAELRKYYWQQKRGFLHKKVGTAISIHNH